MDVGFRNDVFVGRRGSVDEEGRCMFWDGSGSLLSIQNHQVELLLLPAFLRSYPKVIRK